MAIKRILADSGVGLPAYYEWRSRSGCYFCFFQRKNEWAGLLKQHPDLLPVSPRFLRCTLNLPVCQNHFPPPTSRL